MTVISCDLRQRADTLGKGGAIFAVSLDGGTTRRNTRGFALITALLMLVVLTLLGVSMMGGVSLQEKMSGNSREKTRAFEAAQAALQYAESTLFQIGFAPQLQSGTACQSYAIPGSQPQQSVMVCPQNLPLVNPTKVTAGVWTSGQGTSFSPAEIHVSATGGSNVYFSKPQYYVQYAGTDVSSGGAIYNIYAQASGGNESSIAVVHSVVLITNGQAQQLPSS